MPHCADCDCVLSESYERRWGNRRTNGDGELVCAECAGVYDGTEIATDGGTDNASNRTGRDGYAFKVPSHEGAEEDHFLRYGDGSRSFWEHSDRAKGTTIISWDESETPFTRTQDTGGDPDRAQIDPLQMIVAMIIVAIAFYAFLVFFGVTAP